MRKVLIYFSLAFGYGVADVPDDYHIGGLRPVAINERRYTTKKQALQDARMRHGGRPIVLDETMPDFDEVDEHDALRRQVQPSDLSAGRPIVLGSGALFATPNDAEIFAHRHGKDVVHVQHLGWLARNRS